MDKQIFVINQSNIAAEVWLYRPSAHLLGVMEPVDGDGELSEEGFEVVTCQVWIELLKGRHRVRKSVDQVWNQSIEQLECWISSVEEMD